MKKILASVATAGVLLAASACGSGTYTGTDNQQSSGGSANSDCGYSWKPCPSSGASAPEGGGHSSPRASKQPLPQSTTAFRWGDYTFGNCALSLFPPYYGLTISNAHVVVLTGTGCVGYLPQEVRIQLELQRYYSVAGEPRNWHSAGLVLIYDSSIDGPPPLVIPHPDGTVPLTELHPIKGSMPCVRDISQGMSLYRLQITITGTSYDGKPFGPVGGDGSTLLAHNSECNQ